MLQLLASRAPEFWANFGEMSRTLMAPWILRLIMTHKKHTLRMTLHFLPLLLPLVRKGRKEDLKNKSLQTKHNILLLIVTLAPKATTLSLLILDPKLAKNHKTTTLFLMRYIYWNIRGIGNIETRMRLFQMLSSHKPDFLFIVEPLVAYTYVPSWY